MTARAAVRQADLNRALKAAKAHGYVVEIRGDIIRLLPNPGGTELTPFTDQEAEDACDRLLGLQ